MALGLRDFVPPVVAKGRNWLRNKTRSKVGGEQPAAYYDGIYGASDEYRRHYAESVYYSSWTVLVDRMRRAGYRRVLDVGCGPGQFAAALKDAGFTDYHGLDFSARAIDMARQRVPEFRFEVADALKSALVAEAGYDVIVSLEFLEHIELDLEVLARVHAGTRVLATVPNFPSHSHVRHFRSVEEVAARYGPLFDGLSVDKVPLNPTGTALFILEGTRKRLTSAA